MDYDLLVKKIAEKLGVEKEEIERKVEAKRAKLSGLISKEGAAQIIAAESGINFENATVKLNELMPGMKRVNVSGKIINLFPVREFEKNGRKGKVSNFVIADETGNTRVVLWDVNHIELVEKEEIKEGDVVEIENGSVRQGEIHLSGFSDIKKSEKKMEEVKTEASTEEKNLDEVNQGQNVSIRGVVVQMFNPRFFYVCPECGKKANEVDGGYNCEEHGKVDAKERSILNLVLDDGTETIRLVLFSDAVNKIVAEEQLKEAESLSIFRDDILGSEVYVKGQVRKNQLFNNLELNVADIKKVDVDKLVEKLENAA